MTKRMTTTAGAPVPDNQNSLTAGARGPVLLQDYQLIEKLAHQNRERIPERVVHAKGWGAFGTLTITGDISKYTRAKALQPGAETPMLARFSTVAGENGRGRRRARRARLRAEVLHRGGQLGSGRQQHAGVLRPRSAEVPRLHPHPEAASGDQPALADGDVGLLVAEPGEPAPGDDPDVRPRHPDDADAHERLRQPHLFALERCGRALLGEVPLQDPAGPRALHQRRGREGDRPDPREATRRSSTARSARAASRNGPCRCRSCRSWTPTRRPTIRST